MDLDTSTDYLNRGLQKMVRKKLLKIGLRYNVFRPKFYPGMLKICLSVNFQFLLVDG